MTRSPDHRPGIGSCLGEELLVISFETVLDVVAISPVDGFIWQCSEKLIPVQLASEGPAKKSACPNNPDVVGAHES